MCCFYVTSTMNIHKSWEGRGCVRSNPHGGIQMAYSDWIFEMITIRQTNMLYSTSFISQKLAYARAVWSLRSYGIGKPNNRFMYLTEPRKSFIKILPQSYFPQYYCTYIWKHKILCYTHLSCRWAIHVCSTYECVGKWHVHKAHLHMYWMYAIPSWMTILHGK